MTAKGRLEGPDQKKWLGGDDKEKVTLEAKGCWRAIAEGELTNSDEVIPSVVIYTRKRCGRYK